MTGKAVFKWLSVTVYTVWLDEAVVVWNVGIVDSTDDCKLKPQSTGGRNGQISVGGDYALKLLRVWGLLLHFFIFWLFLLQWLNS